MLGRSLTKSRCEGVVTGLPAASDVRQDDRLSLGGILVHADSHWLAAATCIRQLLDSYVPENRRRGFIIHAKEVLGGGRDFANWNFAARIKLIKAIVKIPRKLGMVICLGMVRRDAGAPDLRGKLRPEKFQHLFAFQHCVANADQYLRTYADPSEVASIVAEDVYDMRRLLRARIDMLRESSNTVPADAFVPTSEDMEFWEISSAFRVENNEDR